jgi:RHS repeat-associated protein
LTTTTTNGANTYYSYDQSGHTTAISPNGTNTCPNDASSTCLSYDAQGRLVKVTKASGLTVAMTYNAQGQRMTYNASGAGYNLSETFLYRGGELAQVTASGSQNTTDTYVYRRDGTPLELIRTVGGSTNQYWYEVDGRGNVIALTDASGNTVDSYSYDLWGKPITVTDSVPQRLRFAGAWYDSELGWYWMSTRSYDPGLERFLQPDRSQQEGIFTYAYSGDDPVDYRDSSGMAYRGMTVQQDGGCVSAPADMAAIAPCPAAPPPPTAAPTPTPSSTGGSSGGGVAPPAVGIIAIPGLIGTAADTPLLTAAAGTTYVGASAVAQVLPGFSAGAYPQPPVTQAPLAQRVAAAQASSDSGTAFEGQVAATMLNDLKVPLTQFQQGYSAYGGVAPGNVDFATAQYIVELKSGSSYRDFNDFLQQEWQQLIKERSNPYADLSLTGKPSSGTYTVRALLVYAPNVTIDYKDPRTKALERYGIYLLRNLGDTSLQEIALGATLRVAAGLPPLP